MSNSFLTSKTIARQALPILRDNLVFPALVYKDYSEDFSKKGDTIQVRKPPVFTANEFVSQIAPQNIDEGSVLVSLDKIADVSVELSAKEMALNVEDFSAQILEPAMSAIAEKINSDGLALYKDIPYSAGTAGAPPSSLADFSSVTKALNTLRVPTTDRNAIWDVEAMASLQSVGDIVNAEKCGDNTALREGSIGKILGLNNYMSQGVKKHAKGTLAASSGSLSTSGAKGDGQIQISAAACTGTLLKGDILTIKGANYVVLEDAAAASNSITVKIYPALREAVTSSDTLTVASDHTANLAFHKNAFAFVTRPLEIARGADSYVTSFEGLTLRVTMDYDISYKKQILSIDTLYGVKTLYPELAVRVLG